MLLSPFFSPFKRIFTKNFAIYLLNGSRLSIYQLQILLMYIRTNLRSPGYSANFLSKMLTWKNKVSPEQISSHQRFWKISRGSMAYNMTLILMSSTLRVENFITPLVQILHFVRKFRGLSI